MFNLQAFISIFSLVLSVLPEIYNMAMISNYGSMVQVAGLGLGVMFINMFVFGAFEGLNGAIDTLVSQYYGTGDYEGCNLIFNRARVINSVLFIPVAILFLSSKEILIFLDQDTEVAIVAGKFLIFQIPGMFIFVHFDTLRRYIQAMGHFNVLLQDCLWGALFHISVLWMLLKYVEGDPVIICSIVWNLTIMIYYILLMYFARDILKEVNKLPVFEGAFTGWWSYLSLALPSGFIICCEWWMYEVLTILTGWIGVTELATLVIIFNTHNFVYDFSYGLSQATSSAIGRALAEFGKVEAQKFLKYIMSIEALICILMTSLYLLLFPQEAIGVFSEEKDVTQLFMDSLYYIIFMIVFDSVQIVIGGVIRGIGEQIESSVASFISHCAITLPSAVILAFPVGMGLQGIILGYILGIFGNTVMNTYLLIKSDWELKIEETEDLGFVRIDMD
ncbi:unnamed protein product [Moneuplotes crassus]|uniref:MATE efflux family protein n=1 Tax=Euplotes crassus TaxID=5936 RepID=A0AAD1UH66_EUPCR|nr:unnamed protein product [Moneuplotes crassus]